MEEARAKPDDAVAVAISALDRRISETSEVARCSNDALKELLETRLHASDVALFAAKEALDTRLKAGDDQLLIHIEAQRESVRVALESLNVLFAEKDRAMFTSDERQREALGKADSALQLRLVAMNDTYRQIKDLQVTYASRDSQEALSKQLSTLIERNREDIAEQRGVHLRIVSFEAIMSELTVWRNKVDVRDAEQQTHAISRRTLDDVLAPVLENVAAMQKWQFKIAGALVFITVVLPGIVAFAVYLLTRTAVPVDGLAR